MRFLFIDGCVSRRNCWERIFTSWLISRGGSRVFFCRFGETITLIKDFQSERAFVNIYDPQVEEEQIWNDLSEASPSSMFFRRGFEFYFGCSLLSSRNR